MSIDDLAEIPEDKKAEAIKAFEAYIARHRDELGSLCVGSRVLTWDQVLEEIKKGTEFGLRYLKVMIAGGLERYKRA